MKNWLRDTDTLLRDRSASPRLFEENGGPFSLRRLLPIAVTLGLLYGFFAGWYALISRDPPAAMQTLATTIKFPALFLLTFVVTFPSLYVFSTLLGCRLSFRAVMRLLIASMTINLAVAASLGPILGFFTLSTTSYPFMIILNVILLALAGAVALAFLLHTLRRLSWAEPADPAAGAPPDRHGGEGVFYAWVVIYGLVGAQMGWLLRPFIGNPNMPFTWFRAREGNFFSAILRNIELLMNSGT